MFGPSQMYPHFPIRRSVELVAASGLWIAIVGCDLHPTTVQSSQTKTTAVAKLEEDLKTALAEVKIRTPENTKNRLDAEWSAIWTAITSATPRCREELVTFLEQAPRAAEAAEIDLAAAALLEPLAKDNRRDLIVRLLRARDARTFFSPLVCTLQYLRCRGLLNDGLGVLFEAYDHAGSSRREEIESGLQSELAYFVTQRQTSGTDGRAFLAWVRTWYGKEGERLLPNHRVGISGDEDVLSAPALIDVAAVIDRLLADARSRASTGRNPLRESPTKKMPLTCDVGSLDSDSRDLIRESHARLEQPGFRPRIMHIALLRQCDEDWMLVEAMFEDGDKATSWGFGAPLRLRAFLSTSGAAMRLATPD